MSSKNEHRPIRIVMHLVFFLSGIATVYIGQVIPLLSEKLRLNDLEIGYLFPAQFAGSIGGTLLSSYFGRRSRFLWATVIGCFLMALGVLLTSSGSYAVCMLGFAVNGIGIGLTLPSVNMLVLEMSREHPASALSILNFCWGAGAIVSKPFVDLLSTGTEFRSPSILLAGPLLVLGLVMALWPKQIEFDHKPAHDEGGDEISIWRTPLAWAIAFFNFIHIGVESGMGGWLTTYADRMDAAAAAKLFSPTVLYFTFFVLGRAIAPVYLRLIPEKAALTASIVVIILGISIILSGESVFQVGVGGAITGLGTAAVFPTNVSRFSRTFGPRASRRATPLFVAGTMGGALTNWLIGFVSAETGDLRSGLFVLFGCAAVLFVIQIAIMTGFFLGTAVIADQGSNDLK